jgi:ATP adenylyltransferase/5',5'''-P-1,P-4-tetraphosphate phosphorylase II
MQEQTMTSPEQGNQPKQPMINKIERDAIEFAQSLLTEPKKGQADSLSKIERDAIAYAKKLLSMFQT